MCYIRSIRDNLLVTCIL